LSVKPIEEVIEELAFQVPFKESPAVGDVMVVLEYGGDSYNVVFAHLLEIEEIAKDGQRLLKLDMARLSLPIAHMRLHAPPGSLAAPGGILENLGVFEEDGLQIFIKAVNTELIADFAGLVAVSFVPEIVPAKPKKKRPASNKYSEKDCP
jgi:hypothetical protein